MKRPVEELVDALRMGVSEMEREEERKERVRRDGRASGDPSRLQRLTKGIGREGTHVSSAAWFTGNLHRDHSSVETIRKKGDSGLVKPADVRGVR